jgi:hypothetical protein
VNEYKYECSFMGKMSLEDCRQCFENKRKQPHNKYKSRPECVADNARKIGTPD